jgi:uncharacterized protein YeaO (DUF488 family)
VAPSIQICSLTTLSGAQASPAFLEPTKRPDLPKRWIFGFFQDMSPTVSTYRYASPRRDGEGLRLGVARRVPRGVRHEDYRREGYFDQWLPLLAPSAELVAAYRRRKMPFATFASRYKKQMEQGDSHRLVELLAAISLFLPISIGCYCEDENLCHRSILQKLILKEALEKAEEFALLQRSERAEILRYASPVCLRDFDES